jgi:hypothetical protein
MFQNLHPIKNLGLLHIILTYLLFLVWIFSLSIKSNFQFFDRFKISPTPRLSYIEYLHHKMKSLPHACQQVLCISLKSSSSISPTRIHFYRFIHVVWYLQECRTNLVLIDSDAASNKRCVGKIKCAFLEMINLLLISAKFQDLQFLLKNNRIYNTPFP